MIRSQKHDSGWLHELKTTSELKSSNMTFSHPVNN